MAEVAARDPALSVAELLAPVPLHPSRFRERGFNQSELLAFEVTRALGLPLATSLLERTRHTEAQSGLALNDRRANVRGAFRAASAIEQKRILLVDDVISTGSTVSECARALRKCGAKDVGVVTLAMAVLA